ncbi:hypothetical protein KCH_77400 [Kitasatospora cheerisanensis KCTC 2395]|uniref:Uncharacterized protein n=1 Tax=Kitasatospora cheerisanensis KCTC 2395 TaxID=1348663 RepID=A0A066YQZ2_9ACTN|nr:hypothetical protein KCH_77400 [Kitasatospora cheerisanensis KCTC 2395]
MCGARRPRQPGVRDPRCHRPSDAQHSLPGGLVADGEEPAAARSA